jgi:hypothetical protein
MTWPCSDNRPPKSERMAATYRSTHPALSKIQVSAKDEGMHATTSTWEAHSAGAARVS